MSNQIQYAPSSELEVGNDREAQQLSRAQSQHLDRTKRQIETAMKKQTHSVFEIGSLLIKAKAQVGHGAFLDWVDHNLPFRRRTAQLYMRLADILWNDAEHLGVFQMNTLDALAAKSLDAENRQTVIAEIASGDLKTDDAVLTRITQFAPERVDKSAEKKTLRAQARTQLARLTSELAGDRVDEIISLLRSAGMDDLATAIEDVVTAPVPKEGEAQLDPKPLATFNDTVDATQNDEEADHLPDFLSNLAAEQ